MPTRFENRYCITIKKGRGRKEVLRNRRLLKFTGKTKAKRYAKKFLKGKQPTIRRVYTWRPT